MEDVDDVREGEFVWKIDNLLTLEIVDAFGSTEFKFGKYDCFLKIVYFEDEDEENGEFMSYYVFLNESVRKWMNCKGFCKLSLIDGRGKEFCSTRRSALKFQEGLELMKIMVFDLICKENDLLPEGALTLRLSWWDIGDSICEQECQAESDLNPEEQERKLLQKLSEDYGSLYKSKEDTDFSLRVGEYIMPVHRAVLSARSEVFADMFRQQIEENRGLIVDIPNVDAVVFSHVLYYVYSGQTRGMSADTIVRMHDAAEKYKLLELRAACVDALMLSLTVDNVCDAVLLAHTHGETQLEEEVVQFVKAKWREICQTQKWKELSKSEPSLADKLIPST